MANPFSTRIWDRELVAKLFESRLNYYFSYCINTLLMIWMAIPAARAIAGGERVTRLVMLVFAGYLLWTLFEWLVHKYVYHEWPSAFTVGHGIHHESPKTLIGVPWLLNTPIYFALYGVMYNYLWHGPETSAFMASFGTGYILFCAIHHGLHHWRIDNALFRSMLAHHLLHHRYPGHNIGISTWLWDWIFGTKYRFKFDSSKYVPEVRT